MKVLVTGGAGFVGSNLIKTLIDKKHSVVSIDNYTTGLFSNHVTGCDYVNMDIRNIRDYSTYGNFDIVFHLAAVARIQPSFKDPITYFETNANGTLLLANMCSKQNIPIIYSGSSSYHSGKFKNPYTFSKGVGEEILELFSLNFGLKYSIARFYNVYGPNQLLEGGYTTLIGRWLANIEKGLSCEIYGDGKQTRDFTHVDDIVDALLLIMEKEVYGKVFELGRGKNISVNEVATMFNINPVYKPAKKGEARDTLCDYTLANKVLGWEPKINLIDYIKELQYEN